MNTIPLHTNLVRKYFDQQTGYYSQGSRMEISPGFQLAIDSIKLPGFKTILDIGCGCGFLLTALQGHYEKGIGIDLSYKMLQEANILFRRNKNLNSHWLQGNTLKLPFKSDKFDLICNRYLWHYLPDPLTVLEEIKRVLIPNDKLLLIDRITTENTEQNLKQNRIEKLRNTKFFKIYKASNIEKLLKNFGFTISQKYNFDQEVKVSNWCKSGGVGEETKQEIFSLLVSDLASNKTGLNPFIKNNELFIIQKSVLILACL